jgi:hypothetical protein
MKLVWEQQILKSGDYPVWVLWRRDGLRYVERLGSMGRGPDGYVAYSSDHLRQQYQTRVFRLPADLTLDEAKSAAKLILAMEHTS